jgi:hypothetical protein
MSLDIRWLLALVAGLLLALAVSGMRSALRRRRSRLRMARASWGESRAVTLLADAGYEVVAAQVREQWCLAVDGEELAVNLRADYLAEKEGARFVAEVKTGRDAPRLHTPATRRQLLEYRMAFDVDGVLLVDAELGRVHRIVFPGLRRPEAKDTAGWGRTWAVLTVLVLLAGGVWVAFNAR